MYRPVWRRRDPSTRGTDLPNDNGKEDDVEELRPQDGRDLEVGVHGPDAAVVVALRAGAPRLLLPDAEQPLEARHDAQAPLGDDPRVQVARRGHDPPGRHGWGWGWAAWVDDACVCVSSCVL